MIWSCSDGHATNIMPKQYQKMKNYIVESYNLPSLIADVTVAIIL
jgi:hypothetical protein